MIKVISKRFLSLFIILVMVISLIPASAFSVYGAEIEGLSDKAIILTDDDNGEWKASGTTITGSISGDGCDSKSTRLQIKNGRSEDATLFFDYTATIGNGDTMTVAGEHINASKSDKKSVKISANDVVEITINVDDVDKSSSSIKITYIRLVVEKAEVKVTFEPASGGSTYTVNGVEVTESYEKTENSLYPYTLAAIPVAGYKFLGWYNVTEKKYISTDASGLFNFENDCTITAKFASSTAALFETNGQVFGDLNEAITYAEANTQNKITLISDGTIEGKYTIPAGITLLIPFDSVGTSYGETPGYTTATETQIAYKTLTMAGGSSIEVNGAIEVGGKHFASSASNCCEPTGSYGLIEMIEGSSITLNDGAALYAWGYITGQGNITANSGAKVYEYFQVTDWRGGSQTSTMISERNKSYKVFPFSQYYIQNIESNLILESGAYEFAYMAFTMSVMGYIPNIVQFIGKDGLFSLGNNSTFKKKYTPAKDRISFEISGDANLKNIALSVSGVSADSGDYVLPINSNIDINIVSGKTTIAKDVALLPGTQISIADNAELEIAKDASLYVYDGEQWKSGYLNGSKGGNQYNPVKYSPSGVGERKILVDGKILDAIIDVNGKLTSIGNVYTTESGANICSTSGNGIYERKGACNDIGRLWQCESNKNYVEIPVSIAKLKNFDGSYTVSPQNDETITYKDEKWKHDLSKIEQRKSTCEEVGYKENHWKCSKCGMRFATENDQSTNLDENNILIPATGHSWKTEWTVDKEATCKEEGSKSHHCSKCDEKTDVTVIPMVDHNYQNGKCTYCGEVKHTSSSGNSRDYVTNVNTDDAKTTVANIIPRNNGKLNISDAVLKEIFSKATANSSTKVVIRVHHKYTNSSSVYQINLSQDMIDNLIKDNKYELVINTGQGEFTLNAEILKTMSAKAADGISVTSRELDQSEMTKKQKAACGEYGSIIQLIATDSKGEIIWSGNGAHTAVVEIPDKLADKDVKILVIDKYGLYRELDSSVVEQNGKKYFSFSSDGTARYIITDSDNAVSLLDKQAQRLKKLEKGVKKTKLKLNVSVTSKGNMKLTWKKSKGYSIDYYQVYRAVKKKGFGKKAFYQNSSDIRKYINTKNLKQGKRYYYKVRGVRLVGDKLVYTGWSNIDSEIAD